VLARAAGVEPPSIRWRFVQAPSFDNQIATMTMQGRDSELRIECAVPGDDGQPMLKTSLHRELSRSSQLTRVPARTTTRT
jgi:hypothetical protein